MRDGCGTKKVQDGIRTLFGWMRNFNQEARMMYRVMLADDEGIVLDSLKMIIEKHFPGQCQMETGAA